MPRPHRFAAAASSVLFAAGLTLTLAPSAHAVGCGTHKVTSIHGAKAEYRLACKNGNLRVYGWVKDTRPDDYYAVLSVWPARGDGQTAIPKGWGEVEHFSFNFPKTQSAEVRLSLQN
ncbi:hypothetical protein [Streptomyces sp. MJP52]|uniref:hypothetical protein n=1 Tax=Streptomyces sp. MJP52 TaxID=2940555 RepID=UPI00247696C0|nr:hypothetical protein [Streptomyces sp. MJP52]MDH6223648.1 hypothetical protein [Streptomyces sp. MJP52]